MSALRPDHPWRPWCLLCVLADSDPTFRDLHEDCLGRHRDFDRHCECPCPWLTEEDE